MDTDAKLAALAAIVETIISDRYKRVSLGELGRMRDTLRAIQKPAQRRKRSTSRVISDINEKLLAVPCTRCEAMPGEHCVTTSGRRTQTHAPRHDAMKARFPSTYN